MIHRQMALESEDEESTKEFHAEHPGVSSMRNVVQSLAVKKLSH